MKMKALIAVRSGSQRVMNKNIKPFANSNLLEIKIKQLKRIKEIEGIIVNSNDETMLSIAKRLNVEAVKRDDYFASSTVPMPEVFEDMANNFNGDIVIYANVTNPLITDDTIRSVIKFYYYNQTYCDSVNTAYPIKEFMFQDNKPINFKLKVHPKSQDLPDIFALNFAVNIITKDNMIKYKSVIGKKPYIYAMDEIESTDIDNNVDFEFAEFMYKKLYMNNH